MKNEEILKKAMEKAAENGFICKLYGKDTIFSHDFAKAFWGEEQICEICEEGNISPLCPFGIDKRWQYHLKEMVTEEDPIKYLEHFL